MSHLEALRTLQVYYLICPHSILVMEGGAHITAKHRKHTSLFCASVSETPFGGVTQRLQSSEDLAQGGMGEPYHWVGLWKGAELP
jgi:hypothetical protein